MRLASLALCSLAFVAAACSSDKNDSSETKGEANVTTTQESTAEGGVEVVMKDIKFNPRTAQVKVGQKVDWTNDENVEHNVVARSGAKFESENLGQGAKYYFTARKAGIVQYTCTLHPGMDGTLKITR